MSDTTNNASDGEKREENIEVHSANSWETADLGNDDRKQKFLRLMGASKKEHKGRIVIGDHDPVHTRTKNDVAKISDDLAGQYEQGMEHRRLGGRRGHRGLGFHDGDSAESKETKESEENKDNKDEETGEKKETESKETESAESEKRKHSQDSKEPDDNADESPTKKMKLNFVKAS